MLEEGTMAPDFTLPADGGGEVTLSDYRGKKVVLYFYPKDNTTGCTNEAIDFTSLNRDFGKLGAVVIGISPDSTTSHGKFIDKYDLGVTLLSDAGKKVMKKYGAWGVKKNYGREYEGVIRSTFLIAPGGKVAESWGNVKVRMKRKQGEVRHADVVLDRLRELQS